MPEPAKSDRAALNSALVALNGLQVELRIVSEQLSSLQQQARYWDLHFDLHGKFIGVSGKHASGEIEYPADNLLCVYIQSNCEWLPKHVESLWEAHGKADVALADLPSRLTSNLNALVGLPWVASVRRHCLDKVLAWPGETHHQASLAAEKVYGSVTELLRKAAKYEPFSTWKQYDELLAGYRSDLFAIRDAVQPASAHRRPVDPRQDAGTAPDDPITLQEMSALAGLDYSTIRNWGIADRPQPAIPQSGRRAAVFRYADLRQWLVSRRPDIAPQLPVHYSEARATLSKMSS